MLALIATLIATPALAEPSVCEPDGVPATFKRIIDGDTFELTAHLPLGVHRDITVRLADIDTPEMTGLQRPLGQAAKEFVETWAAAYPTVMLHTKGNGKYGRVLALVCPVGGGQCLGDALRAAGHEKAAQ